MSGKLNWGAYPRFLREASVTRRILFTAAALPILFSCNSDEGPTEPGAFSGEYQIESINGQQLPFIDLITPLTGDTLFIKRGNLSVLSRGRVRIVFHRQLHPRNAPPQAATSDSIVREYREHGDFVYIDHPTGGLQGPYTDTLEVIGTALTLRQFINRYNGGHFWRNVLYVKQAP